MSTESTATSGAGEVVPAVVTSDPKGDEAAYAASKAKPGAVTAPVTEEAQPDDTVKAAEEKARADAAEREKQQKSRTTSYIDRLKADNAEMRRRLAEVESRQSTTTPQTRQPQSQQRAASEGPPTLADCDFDVGRWQQANNEWTLAEHERRAEAKSARDREQKTLDAYQERLDAFVVSHPDFEEVVGAIDPQFFSPDLERAVLAHDKGPAIAYHLATNDEALWQLASVRPELLPAAVARLASRLGAAPQQQEPPAAAVAPPAAPVKPITQAPPPVPQVGGRAVATPPPERMTDDEWYKADRERRRKR